MERAEQAKGPPRVLTQGKQIIFGVSLMAPVAIFGTYGVATEISDGMLPTAYLIAFLVMLITAYSYGRMVKVLPTSGSAYGYVQKAVHPYAGFLVGWTLLLDYAFVPMLSVLFLGLALHDMLPAVPSVGWVAVLVAFSTLLNIRGMQTTIKVNRVIVGLQFLLIAVFLGLCAYKIFHPALSAPPSSAPLFPNHSGVLHSVIAGTALVCQSFLGFDAVTTITDESVEPQRTIPRTLIIVTVLMGALYFFIAYLGGLAFRGGSFSSTDTAALELMNFLGGAAFENLFMVVSAASIFVLVVSQQAGISRLLFVMGQDRVVPQRLFGHLHKRHMTPVGGIIFIGIFTVVVSSLVDLVTLASFINFGAFIAFAFVNISVIAHYYVKAGQRSVRTTLMYFLIPLAGVVCNLWLLANLKSQALIVGGAWVAAGLAYLAVKTRMFRQMPNWGIFDHV